MLESKGNLRTLGCLIAGIGELVMILPLPQVAVWGEPIRTLGILLGGAGCARAIPAGTLFR